MDSSLVSAPAFAGDAASSSSSPSLHKQCDAFFAKQLPANLKPPTDPARWVVKFTNCSFCAAKLRPAEKKLSCTTCGFEYCTACRGDVAGQCEYCDMEQLVNKAGPAAYENKQSKFGVVGGGIGGCCTALALAKAGFQVDVFENRSSIEESTAWRGGMVLAQQPMSALASFCPELADQLLEEFHAVEEFMVMSTYRGHPRGLQHPVFEQNRAQSNHSAIGLERGRLLELMLLQCAKNDKINVHFGHKLTDIKPSTANGKACVTMTFTSPTAATGEAQGVTTSTQTFDFVVGADGIHSKVRKQLFTKAPTRSLPEYGIAGITQYDIGVPVSFGEIFGKHGSAFVLIKTSAVGSMGTAFWAIFTPQQPSISTVSHEDTTRDMVAVAKRLFPGNELAFIQDIIQRREPVHETLTSKSVLDIRSSPALKTMISKDKKVIVLGDAAHAMSNMLGMGGGTSIEDACALGEMLTVAMLQSPTQEDEAEAIKKGFGLWERRRLSRDLAIQKQSTLVWKLFSLSIPGSYWLKYLALGRGVPHAFDEKKRNTMLDFLMLYRPCFASKRHASSTISS